MGGSSKRLEKMEQNPNGWNIEDVINTACDYGFSFRRPGKGGSHVTLKHPKGFRLTVPARRPIKPIYIKKLVNLIKEVSEL